MVSPENAVESDPFPFIPDDLLAELDRCYPEVNPPDTQAQPNDLWRAIGMRQVILRLKWEKQLQVERDQAHNKRV